ncbi:MAG: type III-A CRISPR-associated protein Csm2 [Planctomycetaceae bacterium]|nr:type III-A CRISPR-associated protein Csm2 [Planctomycetaceae bacterium]
MTDSPSSRWRDPALRTVWKQRYDQGYFETAGGGLRLEFVRRAEIEKLILEFATGHPALSKSQVRRFFQHCRWIEHQLKSHSRTWAQLQPEIHRLDRVAADAAAKPKIPESFHEFVEWNVQACRSESDFVDGFLPHFEAVLGFGANQLKDEGR